LYDEARAELALRVEFLDVAKEACAVASSMRPTWMNIGIWWTMKARQNGCASKLSVWAKKAAVRTSFRPAASELGRHGHARQYIESLFEACRETKWRQLSWTAD
jgi:hypothetical protein